MGNAFLDKKENLISSNILSSFRLISMTPPPPPPPPPRKKQKTKKNIIFDTFSHS